MIIGDKSTKNKLIIIGITLILISIGLSGCVENKPPTFDVSIIPTTGYQPLNVTFNVNASDSDGNIETCMIHFGDGNCSNKTKITHTYKKGTYDVNISVIDDKGAMTCKHQIITVNNNPPVVSISASNITGNMPLKVDFNGTASDIDGTVESYIWFFDDGNVKLELNSTHTFTDYGLYEVALVVEDNDGTSNSATISITCTIPIVEDQDLDLLEWIWEKDKELEILSNSVISYVDLNSLYLMDKKGTELSDLAKQYKSDIVQFTDLSDPFVVIRNKYSNVLDEYESIGIGAWSIAYHIDMYDYEIAQIGIEIFPERVIDLNLASLDCLEMMLYVDNFLELFPT